MVVCLIDHYYKILGDKLEKKHKIILAIVAILVIVGVCLYLNYQDTSIDAMTTTYYSGSGTICAKANLMGPNGVIEGEPIRVVIIGADKVVANFTIVSGEEHNVTGLTGQHDYLVSYKYEGHYPYRSSSYDDRDINVVSGRTPNYSLLSFL